MILIVFMLNLKYLSNVFLYFFSSNSLEYVFIIGFYYLIQDYFLLIFSFFKEFSILDLESKENLKFLLFLFIFFSCLY